MKNCFRQGLLKKIKPDIDSALRSLVLAQKHIDDASANFDIQRYRVVIICSYSGSRILLQ